MTDLFPEVRSRPEEDTDSRFTPREFVTALHAKHRFTVDAASRSDAPAAHIIGRCWTKDFDGLAQPWANERVFCNPPWSDIEPWVLKAWSAVLNEGCPLVVMLLPAWTDRRWWQQHVEPKRDRGPLWGPTLETKFLPRMPFGHPGNPDGVGVGQPAFWCVLLTWSQP